MLGVPVLPAGACWRPATWCRGRGAAAPRRRTPARRGARPQGPIETGVPVNPWLSSTPTGGRRSARGGRRRTASRRRRAAGRRRHGRHCAPAHAVAAWALACGRACRSGDRSGGRYDGGAGGGAVFYWFLKWIAIGPLLRIIFRPVVEGAENVPDEGPAILASNHLSYADWLFMPLTLPRRVTFVAKAEYFTTPGHQGLVPAQVLHRRRPGPDRPRLRLRGRGRAVVGAQDPRPRATCSGSIPRARAPTTAGSTVARPAWPGSRSRPRCR